MLNEGKRIHPSRWQGLDVSARQEAAMVELLNVSLDIDLRGISDLDHWRQEIRPNLPWADDHFLERVSGEPLNPPPSWAWWPWNKSAANFRSGENFNHTYPERYWPKQANPDSEVFEHFGVHPGIRHSYGDLNDVVELLRRDPLTRQAYLPIFFPEDTGVGDGGRKPCSLGYQFIVRDCKLHIFYPMRSCDLLRHFRDDCYLTVRLGLWVLEQLAATEGPNDNPFWSEDVTLGSLTMHMTSLHCFIGDYQMMRHELEEQLMKGLS
jgi:hypothetical protein